MIPTVEVVEAPIRFRKPCAICKEKIQEWDTILLYLDDVFMNKTKSFSRVHIKCWLKTINLMKPDNAWRINK